MFNNDSAMNCNTKIPSVANILKNVYLSGTLLNEFTSTYYYDKNGSFEMMFKQYIDSAVENISHPEMVE